MKNSMHNLGLRIKNERKKQNLDQTTLASLAGVGINFLSQLEGGKETVRMDKVLAVMSTLGLEFRIEYGPNGITQ